MSTQENNGPTIIKKYANRRLYNTATSCYITLEDLYEMVKKGEEFEVHDAKTNEDLTKGVLTQIIFEQETKGSNLLSVNFLRNLIGLYDDNMGGVFPNYLNMVMDNFVQNQERMEKMSKEGWQDFSPMKIFENMTKQNMEILEKTMKMFDPNGNK